jgi:hypothetical protein
MDDVDHICDEFHALHDPTIRLQAVIRLAQNLYMATYGKSWEKLWERDARCRPPSPPARWFAGEHLSWDSLGALEVCQIVARANPMASQTAIAGEATKMLQAAIVAVSWRCKNMPVSITGEPETGTATTQCSPDQVPQLRHDIEARYGPILEWSVTEVQAADPTTQHP